MDNSQNTNMIQGMQLVANRFFSLQRKYYMNDIRDEELTEAATQPFWQSMRLSKRRLQEKELIMDVTMWEDGKSNDGRRKIYTYKDGTNQVGVTSRQVVTKRSFYHKGKMIYSKKDYDIATVNLLKTEVDGEEAACPNCGHVGKVAGFIDGCDYCGSKYTVKDFEPKISGFSLEENTQKKIRNTFFKTLGLLGIVTALLAVIAFISGVVFVVYATTTQAVKGLITSMLSLFASLDLLPVLGTTIWILIFLFIFLGGFLMFIIPSQIKGERVVKAVIPDFSSQDFFQHLEYKLRNIHLTDKAKEVNAFASFDLAPIVAGYQDVVDCHMRSLKYLAVRPTDTGYEMDVEVNLKLSVFNGKRIKIKYETVKLLLSGKREILKKSTAAIREYKCPNCDRSISLLEGGVCEYCDTQLDYDNYGWMIQGYEKKFKLLHTYRWIRMLMIGIYILVLVICYKTSDASENETLGFLTEMLGAEQAVIGFYDEVLEPDEIGLEIVQTEQLEEFIYRKCTYSAGEAEAMAQKYLEALVADGMIYHEKSATENSFNVYGEVEYAGDTGYVKVTVSYTENSIVVEYNLASYVGE